MHVVGHMALAAIVQLQTAQYAASIFHEILWFLGACTATYSLPQWTHQAGWVGVECAGQLMKLHSLPHTAIASLILGDHV
jgi:hypothetical protein